MARLMRWGVLSYALVQIGPALWEAGASATVIGVIVLLVMVNPQ